MSSLGGTGNGTTSLMSSALPVGSIITLGISSNYPAVTGTTEKPYAEFAEVKAAILIDRIYVPLVVAMGLAGNTLCFVTLVFSSLRTTSTCVYMAAIALLDSLVLGVVLGFLLATALGHAAFYRGSHWGCGLHYFLFYFSIHLDVLLLLAMTTDRFLVVTFPLRAQRWCTPKSALKAIAGFGVFSLGLNLQVLFHRRLMPTGRPDDPLWCWYPDPAVSYFMRKVYTWIDASIYSFLPFLTLLLLNLLIIRQLHLARRFSQRFTQTGAKTDSRTDSSQVVTNSTVHTSIADTTAEDARNVSTKGAVSTNITLMLLLVTFTFLALTSPVVIMLLVKRYHWLPETNTERARARLTHAFVDNLMYTNHAVNFWLYCISGRRFRQELKGLVVRLWRRC
ncbi:leukotriene B4 receptor 1-like [Babylonia areolata]|uniref:leukotriene B4 receptor 1-like n=1 Tax=Babylonia areolata TaxID=304850 RepID=UPI003FD10C85